MASQTAPAARMKWTNGNESITPLSAGDVCLGTRPCMQRNLQICASPRQRFSTLTVNYLEFEDPVSSRVETGAEGFYPG